MFTILLILGILLIVNAVWAYNDWIMETDNHDVTFSGAWGTSTARILYYGDDYRWAACSGSTSTVSATATFLGRTTVDVSGYYSVFARWVVDPNRSTGARYDIYRDDGDVTPMASNVSRNQEANGGEWRLLGTYLFDTGNRPKVILKNNCVSEADGANVIADAVRWVKENIDAGDTVDEPGIDWAKSTSSVTISSTSSATPTLLATQSITCPRSGYVTASFTGELSYAGPGGNNTYANVLYSLSTSTAWNGNNVQQIADWVVNNDYWKRAAMAIQRIDSCSASQTLTYRAYAHRGSAWASTYVWQPTLVLKYFPTRY